MNSEMLFNQVNFRKCLYVYVIKNFKMTTLGSELLNIKYVLYSCAFYIVIHEKKTNRKQNPGKSNYYCINKYIRASAADLLLIIRGSMWEGEREREREREREKLRNKSVIDAPHVMIKQLNDDLSKTKSPFRSKILWSHLFGGHIILGCAD